MWVYLCVCVYKGAGWCSGVPFQLRLDDSRAAACFQCRVPRFDFRLSNRGRTVTRIGGVPCRGSGCAVPSTDRAVPCLPRIGVCRAFHGSGCAVPSTDRAVPCLPRIGLCRAFHGSGCAVPSTDRGVPCLPRIGLCRAFHGSGCAVPSTDRAVPCLP